MREETYYELLQVSPSADLEIITGAYRALIRRHHPDRNPSPSAEATTKRLNEAWEVLSDPTRRADYDRTLIVGSSSRPAAPPRPQNQRTQETQPPRSPKQPTEQAPPPEQEPRPRPQEPEFDATVFGRGGCLILMLVVPISLALLVLLLVWKA